VKEIMLPHSVSNLESLHVVTEYLDADLHAIIRNNSNLSLPHRAFFMYQLLRGLKFIHSAGVIHRDIKPLNLLVSKDLDLKICDFGLSIVKHATVN
jgi:mitogen-activated protein kinase 1/3